MSRTRLIREIETFTILNSILPKRNASKCLPGWSHVYLGSRVGRILCHKEDVQTGKLCGVGESICALFL